METSTIDTFERAISTSRTGTEAANKLKAAATTIDVTRDDTAANVQVVLVQTAKDLTASVGETRIDELPEGVAGQALQGVAGSSVIDVSSAADLRGNSLVDAAALKDVKAHEYEHELQATDWTANEVVVGGQILTRRDISEAGAMSVQASIAGVSAEYRGIYARVADSIGIESARQIARSGDLASLEQDEDFAMAA